ncbi:MAG TPA: TonB-dependent receptor [Verrucomicrobiae bacterium]|nr:TonB-dependent receptor [Verrucomicrobiae bacterium]
MRRNFNLLLLVVCFLGPALLLAQVIITSTILGTVTDPQGAVIPGARVTLTNVDTGVRWIVTTSDSGDYQFPNLIAGHYKIEVLREGFASTISSIVGLENGTTQRINLGLKMGKITEAVEVTSAAALMKTEDANVSEVIENKFVRDLPVEGRNYLNFAQIVPGFNSGTGDNTRMVWGLASASAPGGAMQLNVGGTDYGVGYYVDGLDNNDNWVEGPLMNVNADTIQEVKAEVSNYSAEYGRDVGQISVTTKSGTNDLHGSVYDVFQNAGLNANDPWSIYQGLARSAYHQNQYGFTVGGPVYIPKIFNGRNKAFFFTSFERLRNSGLTSFSAYVPTTADLQGDFSPWLANAPSGFDPSQCDGDPTSEPSACRFVIYDPTTYNENTGLRTAYPGNKIPTPNPTAVAYLSHFPKPNGYSSSEPGDYDNYSGSYVAGINGNNYSVRGDYNIGSRDFVYFRYLHDSGYRINNPNNLLALNTSGVGVVLDPPGLGAGDGPVHRVNTYQFHYVHVFSPRLSNEFNVSWIRGYNFSNSLSQINALDNSWLPSLFQNTSTNLAGFTSFDKNLFNVSNDSNFAVNIGDNWTPQFGNDLSLGTDNAGEYWYQYVPILQVTDNLSKAIGRHSLKIGYYMARRYERDNDIIRSVNVDGGFTGLGPNVSDGSGFNRLAEFETGLISSMNQRTPASGGDTSLYYATPEYAAYVNDSWNAARKLTVNLGVRYDLPIPTYSVDHYWGVLDQTYPGWRFVMPGLTPGSKARPFSAPKKDFAPRIGLAYRLGDKTVIRSGYGIFYETGRFKFLDQVTWNSPAYGGSSYYSSYTGVTDSNGTAYNSADVFPAPISVVKGTWPYQLGTDGGLMWTPGPGNPYPTSTFDQKTWTTAYLQRWSLDVQRELGKTVVATVGYVGSEGTHLPIQYDLNLFPQGFYPDVDAWIAGSAQCLTCDAARPLSAVAPGRWSAINSVRPAQSNNYNAMNVELRTRGWHGVTTQLSYVWSKQMDTYFGESGEGGARPLGGQWHPQWSYGPSDANHTNRFVAAVTYELPGKKLGNRLLRESIGGWQINSITTFESGAPTTVWNGYTSSYDDMGDVPFRTCNGNLARGNRTFTRAFNTSCYIEPAASTDPFYTNQGIYNYAVTRGDEHRNNLVQPGINNWDMGLQKSFRPLGEGRELQFRADAFNVFNHTQWSGFNTYDDRLTNSASQFGYINGARAGRHMQLNMRFVF